MDVFGEIRGNAGGGGERPRFPELPILNPNEVPAPARRTGASSLPAASAAPAPRARGQGEKYGALFYLGIAGLALMIALVGWFALGVWSNRDIWADVYALNDASRPESERLDAALRLSQNRRLDDVNRIDMAMRRDLPGLARYLLAESVSTGPVARDPRGFALAAARSEGWPDWLRLLLSRRLAYGAGRGYDIPREALDELRCHPDPMIGLWASYAQAVQPRGEPGREAIAALERAAGSPGPNGNLAGQLLEALRSRDEADRERRLDGITEWLRRHHPQAAELWRGRTIRDGRVVADGGKEGGKS